MKSAKAKAGIILTSLELYRQCMPELAGKLEEYWTGVLQNIVGDTAELHFTGVSHSPEEVSAAVSSCEAAKCALLVVLPLTYAPSGSAHTALANSKLPLLLVSTARDATLPYDMASDQIMANHAVHGIQDLANVLHRVGRTFEIIAGHHDDPKFSIKLLDSIKAAAGAQVLRHGRIGRLGEPFEGMLDFMFSPASVSQSLGLEIVTLEPSDLATLAGSIHTKRTAAFIDWVRNEFEVDPKFTDADLADTANWSLALEGLADENGLDAIAMNFKTVNDSGAPTLPFLGASRLMARGIGYAGESDVLTASLMAATAHLAGEATFTEMFCPDYERNEILLSHMGECNYALADPSKKVWLAAKDFAFGKPVRIAVPVCQFRPGKVTLASLTEWNAGKFRLIVTTGEILKAPDHPNLDSPYSRINFG
ncbi:MAG: hypothetical protein WCO51_01375, partial [bacterium]